MRRVFRNIAPLVAALVAFLAAGCGFGLPAAASGSVPDGKGQVVRVDEIRPDDPSTPQIETSCKLVLQPERSNQQYTTEEKRNYSFCAAAGIPGSTYSMRDDSLIILYSFEATVLSVSMTPGSADCLVVVTGDPSAETNSGSRPNAECRTLGVGSKITWSAHTNSE